MYTFSHKQTGKKRVEKNANEFFETQKTLRALVCSALLTVENLTRSTSRTLLVVFKWMRLGAFIISTRKSRIAYQPVW